MLDGMRTIVLAMLLATTVVGCYPKVCDPKTDPLKCQCPSGVCGDYPNVADAGRD